MKKLITLLLVAVFTLLLVSCADRQLPQEGINVYFFTANSANKIDTIFDVVEGSKIDEPDTPVRLGFIFIEWTVDIEGDIPWDFENDRVGDSSVILYAQWEDLILSVTYTLYGGEIVQSEYVTEFQSGRSYVLPTARRTGYRFKGWYEYAPDYDRFPNSDGTRPGETSLSSISTSRTTDLNLHAHWQIISVTVQFRANHPSGTEVVPNPLVRTVKYDDIVTYGDNFPTYDEAIEGYVFIGWNLRADGTGTFIEDGQLFARTQPTTVYGIWEAA
ncbi:MAG: InlB B-repeat-containing protein [Acholeplasma sp.]